jgi:hypothetical protein
LRAETIGQQLGNKYPNLFMLRPLKELGDDLLKLRKCKCHSRP